MTSVSFLPGYKRPIVADFLENIFNETTPGGPEIIERFGAVIDRNAPADEAPLEDPDRVGQGFGFQIHSGKYQKQ